MSTLPDPQPGYRWVIESPESEPRKKGPWRWIVGIAIVVAVFAAIWFTVEWLAREFVTATVKSYVVDELGLPADQEIDVEIEGMMIPQLISGTFGDVRIASEDVVFGSFAGDVAIDAQDVPIRGGAAGGGTATVTVDQEQLRTLMGTVDGFPADSLGLSAPNVTMSTELQLFGAAIPVGVALQPTAVEADLVLTPSSFDVAGAEVSADTVRNQFGVIADVVLQDWTVCVAQYLPAGVALSDVAITGSSLTATFDIDGGIVNDPALQENGTCE
jgi:hypothetical protein